MKRGYIRALPALPEAEQAKAIEQVGADMNATWIEEMSRRKIRSPEIADLACRPEAIRQLRRGDVLVVATLPVLALQSSDFIDTMRAIAARGAHVLDASAGEEVDWPPEADRAMAAVASFDAARRRLHTANARAALAEARTRSGKKKGRFKVLKDADRPAARIDWADLDQSQKVVAEKYGVSTRTLYNEFGPRTQVVLRRRKQNYARNQRT